MNAEERLRLRVEAARAEEERVRRENEVFLTQLQEDWGLSDSEKQSLEDTISRLRSSRRARSLRYLLTRWAGVADQLEKGYSGSIEEYDNDLSVRHLLEQVARNVPAWVEMLLRERLRKDDDRFRQATRAIQNGLYIGNLQGESWFDKPAEYREHMAKRETEWWYFRRPLRLSPVALKDDRWSRT